MHKSVTDSIVCEEMMIPSDTAGIALFVRRKRRSDLVRFSADRTVLFVAGSTYPASTTFDLRLDGLSWMDHLAHQGNDVYLVDVRGYGRSSRPPEMEAPPSDHQPIVRTPVAVRDVASAAAFIRSRRDLDKINLIGWSWGTTLMSRYASENAAHVGKLVLIAPQWLRTTPSAADVGGPLGAYRIVERSTTKSRWLNGVPDGKKDAILPPAWFNAWAEATFANTGLGTDKLRAPNGTVQDSRDYWASGKPLYDPSLLTMPVLIVHADLDRDCPMEMAQTVFSKLSAAPYRRWVEVGEGTHSVFMERNRWQVFGAVDGFLDEEAPA
ncbi:alpha/beta hydrolase [Bradyrhizobium sp. INPA01-394B]|uniref:Alpha/beta fold hydrolase n=1 Tax=Bradyrhizobium campsiandrae TaxID=1729892 RepID=A0ABR7UEA4_9BRAD|nr:alpha/beta fold hydrolase [Bradyrhizobium campsiandrae]MBC9880701.1 alpha/beta hydrolase [Bradyrhizobium campsiandrae]MBC9982218.1 alpha/beta fold hydrolase [Bradyrhizobium campsiandrae]